MNMPGLFLRRLPSKLRGDITEQTVHATRDTSINLC